MMQTATSIIDANVKVHTRLAATYEATEPHFRPENMAKVRSHLMQLAGQRTGRLLDMGCGTGFIISLARDLFSRVDGVDVTQAMLDQVDMSSGNVFVHQATVEDLPFLDSAFDVVTGYAFLHHLKDYEVAIKQAYRVLKPGGCAYFDLDPNRRYWQMLSQTEPRSDAAGNAIVVREIASVLHVDERIEAEYGIDRETFNNAEYTKAMLGGIDPDEFAKSATEAGFAQCVITPQWFMGQGHVMHQQSFEAAEQVDAYLRSVLPCSLPMFKYLRFDLIK